MGERPGGSDFGAYGQLTQLTHFDPTPTDETLKHAPRVFAWVDLMEDLSGLPPTEADWMRRDSIPDTIRALLAEVGCVYVPVLLANAKALMAANRSRRKSMASRGCSSPSPIRENVSSGCAKNMPR